MASELQALLSQYNRPALCESVLPALLDSIAGVAKTLHKAQKISLAGTNNEFGDDQLNVDVLAENVIREALATCPSVRTASSEEDPVEKSVHSTNDLPSDAEKYTVAFDPLDGSSIIAPNWTVGAIFGIWEGESALHQPVERQIASVLGVFGPRTTAIIAIRIPGSKPSCLEIGIGGSPGEYEIVRSNVQLAAPPFKTRYFAPANLRSAGENEAYMRLITHYIQQKYTLRYCGGLVPDILHALVKGHGVYVSPITRPSELKLRRLYELLPVALIVECAGGKAIDPTTGEDILSGPLENCNERAGLVCGTSEEVDFVKKTLLNA